VEVLEGELDCVRRIRRQIWQEHERASRQLRQHACCGTAQTITEQPHGEQFEAEAHYGLTTERL